MGLQVCRPALRMFVHRGLRFREVGFVLRLVLRHQWFFFCQFTSNSKETLHQVYHRQLARNLAHFWSRPEVLCRSRTWRRAFLDRPFRESIDSAFGGSPVSHPVCHVWSVHPFCPRSVRWPMFDNCSVAQRRLQSVCCVCVCENLCVYVYVCVVWMYAQTHVNREWTMILKSQIVCT